MLDAIEDRPTTDNSLSDEDWWSLAGTEFRRHLEDDIRKRSPGNVLPSERKVETGAIDYYKVHAYALDRLHEVLCHVLPLHELIDNGAKWRGCRGGRSPIFEVSLLSGEWQCPTLKKRGTDLVGLVACAFTLRRSRAAILLAQELDIEARRHG
jgi:hypothetical protein